MVLDRPDSSKTRRRSGRIPGRQEQMKYAFLFNQGIYLILNAEVGWIRFEIDLEEAHESQNGGDDSPV